MRKGLISKDCIVNLGTYACYTGLFSIIFSASLPAYTWLPLLSHFYKPSYDNRYRPIISISYLSLSRPPMRSTFPSLIVNARSSSCLKDQQHFSSCFKSKHHPLFIFVLTHGILPSQLTKSPWSFLIAHAEVHQNSNLDLFSALTTLILNEFLCFHNFKY